MMNNERYKELTEKVISSIYIEDAWQSVNIDYDIFFKTIGRALLGNPSLMDKSLNDNFSEIQKRVVQECGRLYPDKKLTITKEPYIDSNAVEFYVLAAIHAVRYRTEEAERCLTMSTEEFTELVKNKDRVAVLMEQVVKALNWQKEHNE